MTAATTSGGDSAKSLDESSNELKKLAKNTLVVGLEALDNVTSIVAETQESFTDLWKDAADEYRHKKIQSHLDLPTGEVKID